MKTFNDIFAEEAKKSYFKRLNKSGYAAFLPKVHLRKRAFRLCPMSETRVVILGEAPYSQPGIADGLAFSSEGKNTPSFLRNIYRELERDLGVTRSTNSLEGWARQGVLLMNLALTTEAYLPGRHLTRWAPFALRAVGEIIRSRPNTIWLLWGKRAKGVFDGALKAVNAEERQRRNPARLLAAHPSPLSANLGFHGCGHFSAVNDILVLRQEPPIDWGRE